MLVNNKANYHLKKEPYHTFTNRNLSVPPAHARDRELNQTNLSSVVSNDLEMIMDTKDSGSTKALSNKKLKNKKKQFNHFATNMSISPTLIAPSGFAVALINSDSKDKVMRDALTDNGFQHLVAIN